MSLDPSELPYHFIGPRLVDVSNGTTTAVAILVGGEMAERTIASVLKTVVALRSPGVRIPLSPQISEAAFGRPQFVFDQHIRCGFQSADESVRRIANK